MRLINSKRNWYFTLGLLCISSLFYCQEYLLSTIPENLKTNNSNVIRDYQTHVLIESIDKLRLSKKEVYSILNSEGLEHNDLRIYLSKSDQLRSCDVFVYDQFGKEIDHFRKKDFDEFGVSQGYNISDNRILRFHYTPTTMPYTLVFRYEVQSQNTAFIPSFYIPIEYNTSVENASYSIENKTNISLRHKLYNTYQYPISEKNEGSTYQVSIQNYESAPREPFAPRLTEIYPKVSFSLDKFHLEGANGPLSDWNQFGKWYYENMIIPTSEIPEKTQEEFKSVVKNAGSKKEKVRLLYQYLQENMRYVSIQLGIGGWKPMMVQNVHENKYGDCKALSNYMRTALEVVDIPSNLTLLYSDRSFQDFDDTFPKFQGNHAILNVPLEDETIWLECTSNDMAFNYITPRNDNRNVLSVNENGGEIIKTPKYKDVENNENISAQFKLFGDGSLSMKAQLMYTGSQYAQELNLKYLDQERLEIKFREKFNQLPNINFKKIEFKNDKNKAQFEEKIEAEVENFAKKVGRNFLFSILPIGQLDISFGETENRQLPFEFLRGISDTFTYTYFLPKGYTISDIPEDISITHSPFGEYHLQMQLEGNKLKVERHLMVRSGTFKASEYKEFAQFLSAAIEADQTKLLLEKL